MWVIVVFSKENSVECIPESWLVDNSSCYWPPHKGSRLNSAITLCENPEDDWKLFQIRRLNADKVYDDLIQARNVCERAQYTSDISDKDEIKRKPKKKIISSSSSEEDESSTPLHINIPPSPPRILKKPREYSEQFGKKHHSEENVEKKGVSQGRSKGRKLSPPNGIGRNHNSESSCSHLDKGLRNPPPENLKTCFDHKTCQEFQQQVIRKLNIINFKLDQMSADINQLSITVVKEKPDRGDFESINLNFPLNSIKELENFESELKAKEKQAEFFAYLAKVGGNSEYENVKRIFGRVMSNELASQFNWLGLKKKKPFNTLQLTNIAKDAVLKNPLIKNCTEKTVEFAIKNWLRHAKDRIKGTEQGTEQQHQEADST